MISKSSKIFLAGHNGMVGSSILRVFKSRGYKKIITINKKNVDLRDQKSVNKFFKNNKPEIVIIAAAKVGGIKANINYPANFITDNILIQTNLILNSFRYKVKKLIFLGQVVFIQKTLKNQLEKIR